MWLISRAYLLRHQLTVRRLISMLSYLVFTLIAVFFVARLGPWCHLPGIINSYTETLFVVRLLPCLISFYLDSMFIEMKIPKFSIAFIILLVCSHTMYLSYNLISYNCNLSIYQVTSVRLLLLICTFWVTKYQYRYDCNCSSKSSFALDHVYLYVRIWSCKCSRDLRPVAPSFLAFVFFVIRLHHPLYNGWPCNCGC